MATGASECSVNEDRAMTIRPRGKTPLCALAPAVSTRVEQLRSGSVLLFFVISAQHHQRVLANNSYSVRQFHAVTPIGEHSVVMLGGEDASRVSTVTAQLYDARADRWSERAEWRLPAPSYGHCAAVLD